MDLFYFCLAIVAAFVVPLVLGAFATKRLGALKGSLLVGLLLGVPLMVAIHPWAGLYGLVAAAIASMTANDWRGLNAVGDSMGRRRNRF